MNELEQLQEKYPHLDELETYKETPHCKIHGAMNCVAIHSNGKLWRCIQSNQLKDCRAGCEEKYD